MFKIIALATILSTIGAISSEMYIPSMPYMATWFHTNDTTVQYSLTAYMLGTIIPALFFGSLADIYGRRKIILIALGIGLIGTLGCLCAPTIGVFIACRFIQGFGFSSTNGLGRALLRDHYSGETFAKYSSYLSMAFAFSVDVTPFFGGILQKNFDWHAIFIFLLVFNCISLYVASKFPFRQIENRNTQFKWKEMVISYLNISRNKIFMRYNLIAACMYSIFMCYLTVASFLWQKTLGVSPETFGLLTLFLSLFYVASCYLNSFLVRFGVDRILQYGLIVVLIAGGGLAISGDLFKGQVVFFVLMAMIFAGSGMVFSNASSMGMSSVKENFSSASAFYSFSSIVVATVFSAIISQFNELSFLPLAIIVICLAGLSLLVHIRRKIILQVNYAE
ncbi:MFS transporter [Aquella oligotrophica]|uniref:Major facilitator superfamily (MFS) profile domain-containing protein n=1 Tax=Aquella oligotrophica TaxID=2067065 RepID=A0A2I7N7J9_9NEIS|nr:MFS transporter [Aquella oligotrophica]AUR52185.1 hypothetical protein CUN60_07700 [Aquella oligotrophica]